MHDEKEERMMETISIRIDDQDIIAQKGSTILETALANKIYIPHLCHHPDLKPAGACRVCLVELDNGQLVTSCRAPVKEGMIVKTKSPGVDKARRPILEMIIANHHMDCKNCLKKGQCELQRIMAFMKIDKKRIQEKLRLPKVDLPLDDSNPFFIRDHNKCILCGICVHTCKKIARIHAIDFSGRGIHSKISTFGDKSVAESICTSCGECVIRCPVGALVVRKPQRPAQEIKTICPYCSVGCSLFLGIREGAIVNVRGDREGPANYGHLCVKGRYGLGFVHSPDRLSKPLIRQGKGKNTGKGKDTPSDSSPYHQGFIQVSWDEALITVAGKLKKYKADEIAVITSTKCTNEENYIAQKFARVVLGTNNIDTSVRLCGAPSISALTKTSGIRIIAPSLLPVTQGGAEGVADLEKAACILIAGANVTRSHPVLGLKIKKTVEHGAKLIVMSTRETDLCRIADIWLDPYPGTDLALIMGMCNLIVEEGLQDNVLIGQHTGNFEDFRESLEDFSIGRVERITGVSRDKIEEAARIYGQNKPSSILWGSGITQYSQGTNNVLSLINLSILTGNIKQPSGLIPLWGQNNALGACNMGCVPDFYPGYQPATDPEIRKKFEASWGQSLNPEAGLTLTEILDATREGKIKALYIIGTDLMRNTAPTRKVKEALKKAKFVVCQDIFMNETAPYAHVILPSASFAEKSGTYTNAERRNQKINKAIDPPGNAKPDWQILCDLANQLKRDGFNFSTTEEIMSEISLVTGASPPSKDKYTFALLQYKPPAEVTDIDYPLIFTTERDLYSEGLLSRKVDSLNMLRSKEFVYINPKDASDFEIGDGQLVKVISRWGKISGVARLTGSTPTGLVSMSLIEEKTNQLMNPVIDTVSKTPEMKICAVRLEK